MKITIEEKIAERPILFSGGMVRAILEGRKSQTRRVVKCETSKKSPLEYNLEKAVVDGPNQLCAGQYLHVPFRHKDDPWEDGMSERIYCPYGDPGDRLWVRETFGLADDYASDRILNPGGVFYRATHSGGDMTVKWKPSIFMPRRASRITLENTVVRVERLQEISENDAKAEGVEHDYLVGYYCGEPTETSDGVHRCNWRVGYKMLWEKINGKGSWDKNPWVWVIEFKQV